MQKTLKFAVCFALLAALGSEPPSAAAQAPAGQEAALAEIVKISGEMREKFAAGKYAEALPLAQQEVALWENLRGKNSGEVSIALLWVAQLESYLGKQNEAILTYQRALKITDALFGPNHIQSSPIWSGLAHVAMEQGRYAEAEAFFRKSIAIDENAPQADVANYWRKVDSLGTVCKFLGKLDEAETLHRRAIAGFEQTLGRNHPDYAAGLANLAFVYQEKAKYPEAVTLYRRALEIKEKALPADHPDVATALSSLAVVNGALKDFAEAERLERRALAIREKSLPAEHPGIATSHSNLGTFYLDDNKLEESEEAYRKALAIYEKALPPDHIYLATGIQNLATVLQLRKDYAQANQLYKRALGIYEKALGEDHPTVAACLENIATSLAANQQWREAADVTDRVRRITRRYVARVLPGLSTKQQFFFLAVTDSDRHMSALSLGLHNRDSAAIAKLSAGWQLNSKALSQQAMTRNVLLARDSGDAQLTAAMKQLMEVRQEMARLAMLAPDAQDRTQHRQKLAELETYERQLSEMVASRVDRNLGSNAWIEVDEVRKAIPAGGVLIDIARFYEYDHTAERTDAWKPMRYAAWIIPAAGQGEIQIVDLGEAKPIDDAVKSANQAMHEAMRAIASQKSTQGEMGEIEAEKTIRAKLAELAQLVWAPLSAKLGDDVKEILLSPDGALWLAPWNALPVDEGRYLIEKYPVRYLVSGRDVVSKPASEKSPTTPIIFADPNFDLDRAQVNSATRAVLRGNVPSANSALRSFGTIKARSMLPKVARLEGTAEEAEAIQPTLAEYAHREPVAYLKQFATEGVFKAVKRPQVLVLSTHGFFMPEPVPPREAEKDDDWRHPRIAAWLKDDSSAVPHPLLRCGVLLAGCNQTGADPSAGDSVGAFDDGILTGIEIVSVDLRGTELVVLSACDTGVGEVQYGEGVSGLRQAFQLAGAKSVVATLWQIPDQESATLMANFFANLAAGQSKGDALRNSQLGLIKSRREQHGAAHPFYWAAFTITGE